MSITSRLKFISTNSDKLEEFKFLLGIQDLELSEIQFKGYQDLNLEEIVREKITYAKKILGDVPFFVEHSGIEVDGWNQLPSGLTDVFMKTVGADGICKMLTPYDERERNATAISVIGFNHRNNTKIFRGVDYGRISQQPRDLFGESWGWDSIFISDKGNEQTYSEMGSMNKSKISMRKKAADEFALYIEKYCDFNYFPKTVLESGFVKELQQFIIKGQLTRSITRLKEKLTNTREYFHVISLESRINKLTTDDHKGILSASEYTLEMNKIRDTMLSLISKVSA